MRISNTVFIFQSQLPLMRKMLKWKNIKTTVLRKIITLLCSCKLLWWYKNKSDNSQSKLLYYNGEKIVEFLTSINITQNTNGPICAKRFLTNLTICWHVFLNQFYLYYYFYYMCSVCSALTYYSLIINEHKNVLNILPFAWTRNVFPVSVKISKILPSYTASI